MNRRSFMALLMGAAVAKPRADGFKFGDYSTYRKDTVHPFLILDQLDVEPGQTVDDLLFAPPVPGLFVLTSILFHFQEDTPVSDLHSLLGVPSEISGDAPGALWIEMHKGRRDLSLFRGPVRHFGKQMQIEPSVAFAPEEFFGLRVKSAGLQGLMQREF